VTLHYINSLAGAGIFSLYHHVQTDSGTHPVSHPLGTSSSFPKGKVVRTWN